MDKPACPHGLPEGWAFVICPACLQIAGGVTPRLINHGPMTPIETR